ncbi:MAG: iron chelate uptake ABC transporter family permease subunit, partial [Gammaproteobacteria bacterium]
MNAPTRPLVLLVALMVLALGSVLLALHAGSVPVGWDQLWATLSGSGKGLAREVILDLRLPRAGSAFVAGALLAVAGALMQVLVRNPLADPYILGVSGGAATGALGA